MVRLTLLLALGATLAGCLPSSCNRVESSDISAADSLSRQIVSGIRPDTLQLVARLNGPPGRSMAYPRTVLFGSDGRLLVSDAERNSIFAFSAERLFMAEHSWDSLAVPYLAGIRGDTLLILNPASGHIAFALGDSLVRRIALPGDLPLGVLRYAAASDTAIYFKATAKDFSGFIARIGDQGHVRTRIELPGSEWRNAGLLRVWGDTLLSLSGFFPQVDLVDANLANPLDSMALMGFDSPMLRRTYAFRHGDTRQAPLITSSAAPLGDALYVLNMRPGWLRIDVFDRRGMLQYVLLDREPVFDKQFYPIDLDVRHHAQGGVEIAVAVVQPTPEIRLYRWTRTNV